MKSASRLLFLDTPAPVNTYLSGKYKKSFAYYSFKERVPNIINSVCTYLQQDKINLIELDGEKSAEDIDKALTALNKLKEDVQANKTLDPLIGNEPDIALWNDFLCQLPADKSSYYHACWLYAECYMYRKISSIFKATSTLQNYDYFGKQKENAMCISAEAMDGIAKATRNIENNEQMLKQLLKLNLWGNRFDLSITSGKEVKPSSNPLDTIKELDSNLIIDSTDAVWQCLKSVNADAKAVTVDFICDNAGFELFTDLILADYLIEKQLACKVRFNVKAIPWFISDVTPKDFHWALKYFKTHESSQTLKELGEKWSDFVGHGKFELAPIEYFWTSPYEFYRMSSVNLPLYTRLTESQLIIFKGDLNYRKLLGDFNWDSTEAFTTCLRGFRPTNLCTLRTIKADLICGLKPGQADQLFKEKADWMLTGAYGVIQFAAKTKHAEEYDEI